MAKNDETTEFEDQLPDPVVRNVEQLEAEDIKIDLLDQLVKHIDQDNYIPWEKVQLPSKGLYYDGKMPDGWLQVKPMGVDIDKMLSNIRLIQSGDLMNKIIEACTRLPDGFNVREMLAGDFNFLMYYLRGITHGPNYEFTSVCPHCKTKNIFEFDLGMLSETVIWANPKYSHEPFSIKMPNLSKTFGHKVEALVRMVRIDDVMKMSRPKDDGIFDPVKSGKVKLHKRKQKTEINNISTDVSDLYENNMKSQIVGLLIDGQQFNDREKLNSIIDNLHQGDSATIRGFLEEVSPAIESTLDAVCANPDCNEESTVSLPFNENFFRPSTKS